jgi:hypothetical protein
MDPDTPPPSEPQQPPAFNYILSFILVGLAWGFTTPFIRRAAVEFNKRQEEAAAAAAPRNQNQQQTESSGERYLDGDDDYENEGGGLEDGNRAHVTTTRRRSNNSSWLLTKLTTLFWTVINLLRTPGYAIPLVLNLTGSVWFFLLVGKHGMFCCHYPSIHTSIMMKNRISNVFVVGVVRRTLPHRPHHQLDGVPVHGSGRVVCGAESDCARDLVGDVSCSWGDCVVREVEEFLIYNIYR